MEAIRPGSSNSLTQFKKMMDSPPAIPTYSDSPPPYSAGRISPAPNRRVPPSPRGNVSPTPQRNVSPAPGKTGPLTEFHFPADPNPYSPAPKLTSIHHQGNFDDDDEFLSASLPPLTTRPQEYLVPSRDTPPPTSKGGLHLPPQRVMSEGHMSRPKPRPHPRPHPRRRTTPPVKYPPTSNGDGTTPDDPDYIKMMSSPIKESSSGPTDDKQPHYLEVVGDPSVDDDNYVIPDPPYVKPPVFKQNSGGFEVPGSPDSTPQQGAVAGDGATNLVDTISQHFNREQIGMLIQMLQEVR